MQAEHPLRAWRKSYKVPGTERVGLSQAELGAEIGVVPSQISQIESGLKGCSLETAIKIRRLAGDAVPLESLSMSQEAAE